MKIEREIPLLEELLAPWRERIGRDYAGYRNHVYRMLHFCFVLHPPTDEERRKLIIAAAFHDIGIWSDGTVDYLPPSVRVAKDYLSDYGLDAWAGEVGQIVDQHHQLTAYRGAAHPLVEVFRRGDLVDFSLGLVRFGIPGATIAEVKAAFPNAGFHKRLMQLTWQQFRQHPLDPLPMMKW